MSSQTFNAEVVDAVFRERDQLKADNAKLLELVRGLLYCANEAYGMCARATIGGDEPFTCCPIYDYKTREYGCEKLMSELGVEVPDGD